MGFGACSLHDAPAPVSPPSPLGAVTSASNRRVTRPRPRRGCEFFYWDLSSAFIKSLCLALFFVVESPRRAVSYVTRNPEPKPFFTCHRWGYRMCACGHHYYHHQDPKPNELNHPPPSQPPSQTSLPHYDNSPPNTRHLPLPNAFNPSPSVSKRNQIAKRRWFWPF
ncbi:unnamed protein product [Agarophyton chilense]